MENEKIDISKLIEMRDEIKSKDLDITIWKLSDTLSKELNNIYNANPKVNGLFELLSALRKQISAMDRAISDKLSDSQIKTIKTNILKYTDEAINVIKQHFG